MNRILLFLLCSLSLFSCTGMYDNIEEYWNRGEIPYIGTPDSAKVYSGKNRAKLEWLVNADPRIEKCIVYWNFREDSVEVEIDRSLVVDGKYSHMLDNMEEGSYVFELVNVGSQGYPSIAHEVIGDVYGEKYQSMLSARKVLGTSWDGNDLILSLGNDDSKKIRFTYIDRNEQSKQVEFNSSETTYKLPNCKEGSVLDIQTIYLPEEDAIDEFIVESQYELPVMFDRTGWVAEAQMKNGVIDQHEEYPASYILDGDEDTFYHNDWNVSGSSCPHTIIVDMQKLYTLTEFSISIQNYTRSIEIRVSPDEMDWEQVGVIKFNADNTTSFLKLDESKSARYIKITGTEGAHTSIREFKVFGFNE